MKYNSNNKTKYAMSKKETDYFKSLLRMTQAELKDYLDSVLAASKYTEIKNEDGFLYAKGETPILLVAHLDTVHKAKPTQINQTGNLLSSPQGIGGDDRCGVYIITQLLDKKPSVLFCEDEETGGKGANKFVKTEYAKDLGVKFIVEFDRRGSSDAVFYNCDNATFEKFVTEKTGFKTSYGTFSDISVLAPNTKIAAVNLSSGYYREHTASEEINLEHMMSSVEVGKKLIDASVTSDKFEYVARTSYSYYGSAYGFDDYNYLRSPIKPKRSVKDMTIVVSVRFYNNETGDIDYGYGEGKTKGDAWFDFFENNPSVCYDDIQDCEFE